MSIAELKERVVEIRDESYEKRVTLFHHSISLRDKLEARNEMQR